MYWQLNICLQSISSLLFVRKLKYLNCFWNPSASDWDYPKSWAAQLSRINAVRLSAVHLTYRLEVVFFVWEWRPHVFPYKLWGLFLSGVWLCGLLAPLLIFLSNQDWRQHRRLSPASEQKKNTSRIYSTIILMPINTNYLYK